MINSRKQPPKGSSIGKGNGIGKKIWEFTLLASIGWIDSSTATLNSKKDMSDIKSAHAKLRPMMRNLRHIFLHLIANLVRRYKVASADVWNCDENGITMGRNQIRSVAIVHRTTKEATMTSEGSCEFCSVLDTINAAGPAIPPFIVWKGKTHRASYNNKSNDQ